MKVREIFKYSSDVNAEKMNELCRLLKRNDFTELEKVTDLKDQKNLNSLLRISIANDLGGEKTLRFLMDKGANPLDRPDDGSPEAIAAEALGKTRPATREFPVAHHPYGNPLLTALGQQSANDMYSRPNMKAAEVMYKYIEENQTRFPQFTNDYKVQLLRWTAQSGSDNVAGVKFMLDKVKASATPEVIKGAMNDALKDAYNAYGTGVAARYLREEGAAVKPTNNTERRISRFYDEDDPAPVKPEARNRFISEVKGGKWSQNQKDELLLTALYSADPQMIKAAVDVGGNPLSAQHRMMESLLTSPKLQSHTDANIKKIADTILSSPHMRDPLNRDWLGPKIAEVKYFNMQGNVPSAREEVALLQKLLLPTMERIENERTVTERPTLPLTSAPRLGE